MSKVTRPLDSRRRASRYMQNATHSLKFVLNAKQGLSAVIASIDVHRQFWSYDSNAGVLVVANLSDIPAHRAKAARILGGPVKVAYADGNGTIWIRA